RIQLCIPNHRAHEPARVERQQAQQGIFVRRRLAVLRAHREAEPIVEEVAELRIAPKVQGDAVELAGAATGGTWRPACLERLDAREATDLRFGPRDGAVPCQLAVVAVPAVGGLRRAPAATVAALRLPVEV